MFCSSLGLDADLVDWLIRAVELMLRSNTLECDGRFYRQATGTAIGAPFACSYSGTSLGKVEEEAMLRWSGRGGVAGPVQGRGWNPRLHRAEVGFWKRFRDDCLGLFRGSKAEFQGFVALMNAVDRDIKFTSEIDWEKNEVVFLDLTISIDRQGYLQTDLYSKPNAKNSLLLPTSCHPPSVTRSSIYSLALRVNRNCSTQEATDLRYSELEARLKQRGYRQTIITAGIDKAKGVPRQEALRKLAERRGDDTRQHRLITA